MSSTKREFCKGFAQDDARRASSQLPSVSTLIMAMDDSVADAKRAIETKGKGQTTHLKTTEAWLRRAQACRLSTLERIAQRLAEEHPPLSDDVEEDIKSRVNGVELVHDDDVPTDPNDGTSSEIALHPEVEMLMRQDDDLQSVASNGKSVVSTADKSTVSISRTSTASKRAGSTVSRSAARSEVSIAHLANAATSSAHQHTADPTDTCVVQSLGSIKMLEPKTEDEVNDWYNVSLNELEARFDKGELRPEQFKRKRAMLRVEYWGHLDRCRNNATPTVIGFKM